MAKALHTLGSTFILPLVLVMLAGLKEGFVEGQSGHLPQEEGKENPENNFLKTRIHLVSFL